MVVVCALNATHQAVDNMVSVRVVMRIRPLPSDKVHDLMFTFTWHTGIRKDDLELMGK
jgi:hypothetical protein